MSTLAQNVIERGKVGNEKTAKGRSIATSCLKYAQFALNPPALTEGHALNMTHLRMKAERFIFEEDPASALFDLIASKQVDMSTVYKTARLPAPVVWIEFVPTRTTFNPEETMKARWGVLIVDRQKHWEILCVMEGPTGKTGAPYLLGTMSPLPETGEAVEGNLVWFCDANMDEKERNTEFEACITDVICALFFLTVPRICEIREAGDLRKLQKARAKKGKPPLVELKRVSLSVGVGRTRYSRSGQGGGGHSDDHVRGQSDFKKRLHPVIGHLRVYTKRQKEGEPLGDR